MTRSATTLDRLAALLVGLAAIAAGVAAVGWNTFLRNAFPDSITASPLVTAANEAWWPWAVTAVGIVLVLLGLRWLVSHSPAPKAAGVSLTGSGQTGRLIADLGAIAEAAAHRLDADPNVASAKAKAIDDRGLATLDITITAASIGGLAAAAAAADRVCCDAVAMLEDDSVATRTRIRVPRGEHGRRVT